MNEGLLITCRSCKSKRRLLLSKSNPLASEWYCPECAVSTLVTEEELRQILPHIAALQRQQGEQREGRQTGSGSRIQRI